MLIFIKIIYLTCFLLILSISTIRSYNYDYHHHCHNKDYTLLNYNNDGIVIHNNYGSVSVFCHIRRFRFLNKAMKYDIIDEDIKNKYSNIKNEISITNLINDEKDQTPLEFADHLKQLAAKRKIKLSNYERLEVFRIFLTYINRMNHEEISNSIWALGTLNITINDFTKDNNDVVQEKKYLFNISNTVTTTTSNSSSNSIMNDQLTVFLLCIDRYYQFENSLLSSTTTSSLRVNILRTVSGLGKMKFKWKDIPIAIKDCFIKQTSMLLDNCDGDKPDLLLSRELSSALYTLGQLEATKYDFPPMYLNQLLYFLGNDVVMQGFTTQGFVNALHGIARIGITWSDLNTSSTFTTTSALHIQHPPPPHSSHVSMNESDHSNVITSLSLQDKIVQRSKDLLFSMRTDEFCSFLNSLALLNYKIANANHSFKCFILNTLLTNIPLLVTREVVNVIWSLGKINLKYNMHPQHNPHYTTVNNNNSVIIQEALSESSELRQLILQVKTHLCYRLEIVAKVPHIKCFDLESLLIGFSLMEISFADLSESYQIILTEVIESNLPQMNIFALHNTLLGLAKMKTKISQLKPKLSEALLKKTMLVLHTFLPIHYGDVIWSLGTLGYSLIHNSNNNSNIDKSQSDRLLAIVSRVFGTLHVRAAAYLLQGLAYMGYKWGNDFQSGTCSLLNGREAPPLANSITKYIRQRVCSMREHEFSVLIRSLGALETPWNVLPYYAREKVDHRITRVASFLTSQSLSNLFIGLNLMNVTCNDLSIGSKLVLEHCLITRFCSCLNSNISNDQAVKNSINNTNIKLQGFHELSPQEFTMMVYSIRRMNFELDGKIQDEINQRLSNIQNSINNDNNDNNYR